MDDQSLIPFSGEFFDLTITSYDNIFGKSKIDYVKEYGINTPLKYFYDELVKILDNIDDNKFEKRAERLIILDIILNDLEETNRNSFSNFFSILIKYLNGGNNSDNFENNKLLVLFAGGNIFTIFIKLLNIIFTFKLDYQNINSFILKYFKNNFKDQLDIIIQELISFYNNNYNSKLESYNKKLIEFIKKLDDLNFSDLDFNLLPGKTFKPKLYGGAPKKRGFIETLDIKDEYEIFLQELKNCNSKLKNLYKYISDNIISKNSTQRQVINIKNKIYTLFYEENLNNNIENIKKKIHNYSFLTSLDLNLFKNELNFSKDNSLQIIKNNHELLKIFINEIDEIYNIVKSNLEEKQEKEKEKKEKEKKEKEVSTKKIKSKVDNQTKKVKYVQSNNKKNFEKYDGGVIIFRIKTNFKCSLENIKNVEPNALINLKQEGIISDCYNIHNISFKYLIPQLFKQEYIDHLNNLIKNSKNIDETIKYNKCLNFLEKLKIKSNIIKYATNKNSIMIHEEKIDIFINIIHLINNNLNKYLENELFINKSISFDNINNIVNSDLLNISCALTNNFLNLEIIQKIMNKINSEFIKPPLKLIPQKSIFSLPIMETSHDVNKLKEVINNNNLIKNLFKNNNNGFKFSVNLIRPDKIKKTELDEQKLMEIDNEIDNFLDTDKKKDDSYLMLADLFENLTISSSKKAKGFFRKKKNTRKKRLRKKLKKTK